VLGTQGRAAPVDDDLRRASFGSDGRLKQTDYDWTSRIAILKDQGHFLTDVIL
jgi:hypothetical protein